MTDVRALICPQCGSSDLEEISWDRRRCRHCGTEMRLSDDRNRVELLQWVCPRCGTNNAVGTNFCRQCGEPLAVRCPHCGQEEYIGSRFCPNCGRSLEGAPPVLEEPAQVALPAGKPRSSSWAIASLILALLGLGPAAVICGHVALAEIRRGTSGGQWIAVLGLVLGYLLSAFFLFGGLVYLLRLLGLA